MAENNNGQAASQSQKPAGAAKASGEEIYREAIIERAKQQLESDSKDPKSPKSGDAWDAAQKKLSVSAAAPEDIEEWAVVVDDSPASMSVVAGILKSLNMGVHSFRNANAALKFFNQISDADLSKIVMIFTDYEMPEMNGLDFLAKLRSEARTKTVPAIIVSGIVEKNLLAKFAALKIEGYVVKPFKAQAIIDRVMHINILRQKAMEAKAKAG